MAPGILLDWRHCGVDLVVILHHEIDIGREFTGSGDDFSFDCNSSGGGGTRAPDKPRCGPYHRLRLDCINRAGRLARLSLLPALDALRVLGLVLARQATTEEIDAL